MARTPLPAPPPPRYLAAHHCINANLSIQFHGGGEKHPLSCTVKSASQVIDTFITVSAGSRKCPSHQTMAYYFRLPGNCPFGGKKKAYLPSCIRACLYIASKSHSLVLWLMGHIVVVACSGDENRTELLWVLGGGGEGRKMNPNYVSLEKKIIQHHFKNLSSQTRRALLPFGAYSTIWWKSQSRFIFTKFSLINFFNFLIPFLSTGNHELCTNGCIWDGTKSHHQRPSF